MGCEETEETQSCFEAFNSNEDVDHLAVGDFPAGRESPLPDLRWMASSHPMIVGGEVNTHLWGILELGVVERKQETKASSAGEPQFCLIFHHISTYHSCLETSIYSLKY
jgi:hypothetical protein